MATNGISTSHVPQPRKNWLASIPRSASNLLTRVLNLDGQPNLLQGVQKSYFFLPSSITRYTGTTNDAYLDSWTPEKQAKIRADLQQDFDAFEAHVCSAKAAGKDLFVKEHTLFILDPVAAMKIKRPTGTDAEPWIVDVSNYDYDSGTKSANNISLFPDSVLRSWRPTFLIRHPALAFPSLYRASIDNEGLEATHAHEHIDVEMTLTWSRTLYDWYVSNTDVSPLVLDGDDITSDQDLVRRWATTIGLDANALVFKWDAASEKELADMHPVKKRMLSSLAASTGVVAGNKASGLRLEEEVEKWQKEFGPEDAKKLERWTRDALGDYEYLWEKRFR